MSHWLILYMKYIYPNLRKIRISIIFVKKIRQIEGGSAILHFDEVFRLSHISTFFAKFMFKTCDIQNVTQKRTKIVCQSRFHKRHLINNQKYFKSSDLASLDPRQIFKFDS